MPPLCHHGVQHFLDRVVDAAAVDATAALAGRDELLGNVGDAVVGGEPDDPFVLADLCVECVGNGDCRVPEQCDPKAPVCVRCLKDSDCPLRAPVCAPPR